MSFAKAPNFDYSVSTPYSNRRPDAQNLTPKYNAPLALDNCTASVDGLRLMYTFKPAVWDGKRQLDSAEYLNNGLFRLCLTLNMDVDCYERLFRISAYRYTYTIKLPENQASFAVMALRYTFQSSKGTDNCFVCDINPNKCVGAGLDLCPLFNLFNFVASSCKIGRFDLAFDFDIPRENLLLQKRPRSRYLRFDDESLTEYVGKRSQHNSVKLYDKGFELGLDSPLTRLEITIDYRKYKGFGQLWPTVLYMGDKQTSIGLFSYPFAVIAIALHPDLLAIAKKTLSRNTFKSYCDQLNDFSDFSLRLSECDMKLVGAYIQQLVRCFAWE